MNTPAPTKTCRQCGGPMASNAPEGLCARCLLSVAMKEPEPSDRSDMSAPAPADFPDIADPADVARRLPQFEILELLGRGGMGVVYKARQLNLDRIVALKILPPADALTPDFVERFRREARSLAKLSHPNIVNVHDFGESGGLYYFVMEFVDGVNLRDMIRAGKMKPEEALAVVPKICDALQFAHEEGVVHRDIKPENILIDKRGRVKIADFGLAKLLRREQTDHTLTMSGMTLGTPRYMAPEQLDKPETVDHRADIYSLGVVFYEMLTGEVPMGRFAPPSAKVHIDVRLDEIVLHALERDVERRYQHASEMRTEVETVSSTPRTAPAPGPQAGKPWPAWVWWTLLVLSALPIFGIAEVNRIREMLGHGKVSWEQGLPVLLLPGAFAVIKLLELRWAKAAETFSQSWLVIIVALFGVCVIAIGPFPHVEWYAETLATLPQKVANGAGASFELPGFSQKYVKHGYEYWQGLAVAGVSILAGAFLLFAPRRPRWNVACSFMLMLAAVGIGVLVNFAFMPLHPRGFSSFRMYTRPEVDELVKTDPAFRQFQDDFRRHAETEAEKHDTAVDQLFIPTRGSDGRPENNTRLQDYPSFGIPFIQYQPAYGAVVCGYAEIALFLIGAMRLRRTMQSSPVELVGVARCFRAAERWSCLLLLAPILLSLRAPWLRSWAAVPIIGKSWVGPLVEDSYSSKAGTEFWQCWVLAAACSVAILAFIAVALKLWKPGVRAAAFGLAGIVCIVSIISFENRLLSWTKVSWRDFHAVAQHGAAAAESPEIRQLLGEHPHFVAQLAQLEKNVQALIATLTAREAPPTAVKNADGSTTTKDAYGFITTTSADRRTITSSFDPYSREVKIDQARRLKEGGVVDIHEERGQLPNPLLGLGLLVLGIRDGYRCWKNRRACRIPSPIKEIPL